MCQRFRQKQVIKILISLSSEIDTKMIIQGRATPGTLLVTACTFDLFQKCLCLAALGNSSNVQHWLLDPGSMPSVPQARWNFHHVPHVHLTSLPLCMSICITFPSAKIMLTSIVHPFIHPSACFHCNLLSMASDILPFTPFFFKFFLDACCQFT